ncbi:MAG: GTP cyclohydrolase I FolE [Actinobacteria bacterium]|nr:GTP cyclohydrolase I FolE [Actinomycetota bacterium]
MQMVCDLLRYIGEDPAREGLLETPSRFLKAWREYTRGYLEKPEDVLKSFEDGAERVDEMVIVRDIPVYSLCEHHLIPFIGKAHVAYIPNRSGNVIGLSKVARLVDGYAKRPQVQERLTRQVADALEEHLQPRGVLVVVEAEHLCMSMRGVRKAGSSTVTSSVTGIFRANVATRAEAMRFLGQG